MATENKPKKVKIKLPLTRTEKDDVYVAVNGKSYLIKRGETVEVPESVVEVLNHREEMLAQAMAFEDQASANAEQ
jgi:deoxycytidine triphosphate deaminase